MAIEHQKFGYGKIVSLEGQNDGRMATIDFDKAGQKKTPAEICQTEHCPELNQYASTCGAVRGISLRPSCTALPNGLIQRCSMNHCTVVPAGNRHATSGREEILNSMECDGQKVIADQLMGTLDKPVCSPNR